MMLSQNKTVNYVVGGIALASVALLAYTVTRPTRAAKRGKKRKTKRAKAKGTKLEFTFNRKPIDIHLVMATSDGFEAHVAGDKKNQKEKLQYGSRLIRINNKRVDGLPFEDIMKTLQSAKTPIVLKFRAEPELCAAWTKAEALKEEGNALYKAGETSAAIDRVSAAIAAHPTNRIYYSNRILMFLKEGRHEMALADCQTIRELDPQSTYIKGHYLRGLTLFHLKKYKVAASAFQMVIKLNPSFKKASDRLDECLKALRIDADSAQKSREAQQQRLREQFAAKQQSANQKEDGAVAAAADAVDVAVAAAAADDAKEESMDHSAAPDGAVEAVEAAEAVQAVEAVESENVVAAKESGGDEEDAKKK